MTAEAFTIDPDDALSVLHRRVLESARALIGTGHMIDMDEIARHAWDRLTEQERAAAVPELLASYVGKIAHGESAKVYQREAADPDVTTYLRDSDVLSLWDSHADPSGGPDQAVVDRTALLNLLCEDELLRHRLDMARGKTTSPVAEAPATPRACPCGGRDGRPCSQCGQPVHEHQDDEYGRIDLCLNPACPNDC